MATGRVLKTLEGHAGGVTSVAWDARGERLASGGAEHVAIFALSDQAVQPRVALYHFGGGLALTADGHAAGDPDALDLVRFSEGWALYDFTDLPERLSPERVATSLRPDSQRRRTVVRGTPRRGTPKPRK
jgi:hypothetical protein